MPVSFEEVIAMIGSMPTPLLVAIDGLPLAGKTTLALRLMRELDADCLWLDDFVKPEADWPTRDTPSFPFNYIRYGEFMAAVRDLAQVRRCSLHPYDWDTGRIADQPKVVRGDRIALVEGVSALHPDLTPLYDFRVWVDSDAETTLSASFARGVGAWAREWEVMFMPSAQLYLQTDPKSRADIVAMGRGLPT